MDFDTARAELITQFGSGIKDNRVLTAMSVIPLKCFVPAKFRYEAMRI